MKTEKLDRCSRSIVRRTGWIEVVGLQSQPFQGGFSMRIFLGKIGTVTCPLEGVQSCWSNFEQFVEQSPCERDGTRTDGASVCPGWDGGTVLRQRLSAVHP